MTARKSEGELLKELHTQLQETQAADFETNRASMIALVEQLQTSSFDRHFGAGNGTTLLAVENAFIQAIEQIIYDEPVKLDNSMTQAEKDQIFAQGRQEQAKEQERRLDALEKEVSPLRAGAVLHLFSRLEYIAGSVIRPLLALVRTIAPARIKEQCPWLPETLILTAKKALTATQAKGGSHTYLTPAEQDSLCRECIAWIQARTIQKTEKCEDFDSRMAKKYPISTKSIEKFRQAIQRQIPLS